MKKKFGTGILVFVLCFGYLFLQNKIPDEVSVRPGETLQLHTGIPLWCLDGVDWGTVKKPAAIR